MTQEAEYRFFSFLESVSCGLVTASDRRMIFFWCLWRNWFPTRFLVPVHIVVNMPRSLVLLTTPYAHISLHPSSESLFSPLHTNQIYIRSTCLYQHVRMFHGSKDLLTLSENPVKASSIEENLITLTSLKEEKIALN